MWRTFEYDIHQSWPPIIRLSFHLENEQSITFPENTTLQSVVSNNEEVDTMFLAWFEANKKYPAGRELTYVEYPTRFVYIKSSRIWQPRKMETPLKGYLFSPGSGNVYFLRLMLTMQKGCMSYDDLKTVNGTKHGSLRKHVLHWDCSRMTTNS